MRSIPKETFQVWSKTATHPHPLLGGEQEGWVSDLGWRQFRTFLEGKAEKYGRDFRVISRWEPTSQMCSCCGFKGGKLDLSVREWECLNCGTKHDRDENAAINILVAGGQSETKNGHGGKCNPPPSPPGRGARGVGAAACEMPTRRGATAR
ncbi:MAG: transposase [Okeania sp. SIO2G4]|uniref:RNA-guided endonuclease InsQ/TnpB family protein n=1 Tax=unclassified Okeania TaxID=2634635 RepID=UPI0013B6C717|nr:MULTISPECIES: zinc ribbon domain-containing protein [unclassified Okeania]NEP05323.1 transposase [Okeania sp. SIO4D6]NEP38781.1 transposase [Okeania sp. SIO2H7]NEP73560.1 transposase [Okeania sp. SIO2G5]NEP94861.1 transposase [Okeania sp. SIO2F5]NEQ92180.1 transposase [Okeania sp. SIO2G4]